MTTQWLNKGRIAVYARTEQAFPALDFFKESKKSGRLNVGSNTMDLTVPEFGGQPIPLDFNTWLPFASPYYKISADPRDYVIVPVICRIVTELPFRCASSCVSTRT
jgi:uncharacterized NAD(P)/FAD-binding protein YdhS